MQDTFPLNEKLGERNEAFGIIYDHERLDVNAQLSRNENWRDSGECPGPDAVGKIELTPEALDILKGEMQFKYTTIEKRISEGDTTPTYFGAKIVDDEIVEVELSSQANIILSSIENSFNKIINADISGSSAPDAISQSGTTITAGLYTNDNPDLHLDYETGPFRYVVTLAGPTTEFVHDKIEDTSVFNFDDGSLVNGAQIDCKRVPANINEVIRFLGNADPHALPVCSEPVFRIFVNGYVYGK